MESPTSGAQKSPLMKQVNQPSSSDDPWKHRAAWLSDNGPSLFAIAARCSNPAAPGWSPTTSRSSDERIARGVPRTYSFPRCRQK